LRARARRDFTGPKHPPKQRTPGRTTMPEAAGRAGQGVVELEERPLQLPPITKVRLADGSTLVLPPRRRAGDGGGGDIDDGDETAGTSSSTTTYPVYTKRYSADGAPATRKQAAGEAQGEDEEGALSFLPPWMRRVARDQRLPFAVMVAAAAWPFVSAQWRRWRRRRRRQQGDDEAENEGEEDRTVGDRRAALAAGGHRRQEGLAASTVLPAMLGRPRSSARPRREPRAASGHARNPGG
jgi:hypothetical protein